MTLAINCSSHQLSYSSLASHDFHQKQAGSIQNWRHIGQLENNSHEGKAEAAIYPARMRSDFVRLYYIPGWLI